MDAPSRPRLGVKTVHDVYGQLYEGLDRDFADVLHAFFYGALLRVSSPYTLLLILTVIAVLVGQAVGIRPWRR